MAAAHEPVALLFVDDADSSDQALESLSDIENLDAGVLLFGHGDPWPDGVAAAVESARRLGPS